MADAEQRQLKSGDAEKKNMDGPSTAMWSLARDEEVNAAAAKAYSHPPGTVEDMFVKPQDVAAARSDIHEEEERREKKKALALARKVKEKVGSVKDTVIGHHDHVKEGANPRPKVGCMDTVKTLISGPMPKEDNSEDGDIIVSARPRGTLDPHRERGFADTWSTDTEGAVHGGRRGGGDFHGSI